MLEEDKIAKLLKELPPAEAALVIKAMFEKQQEQLKVRGPGRGKIGYYNAEVANQVKVYVDHMIETNEDVEFFFEDFPTFSPHTIRCKIDGGVLYLVENDPTGRYAIWRKSVRIRRFPSGYGMYWLKPKGSDLYPQSIDGVLIGRIRKREEQQEELNAKPPAPYMEQVTNFIENATSGQHIVINNLKLTATDITKIYALFEPIKDEFELRVVPDRIIIHKGKLTTNEDTSN